MVVLGTVTALITPFIEDQIDEEGFQYLIERQILSKIDALLVLGTTGEAPTLSLKEQERIICLAKGQMKDRVPLWVGTGAYCTQTTIEKTLKAQDLGADIALIVTPYYNKPTQEGIFQHFEKIAQRVSIPIVVYNIPGRCGTNIEKHTLERLLDIPTIIGIKECAGTISQTSDFIQLIQRKRPDFALLSGDDALAFPMISLGAKGLISVCSNLIPKEVIELVNVARNGKIDRARDLHFQLLDLFKVLFIETNPIPIKAAMDVCGLPSGKCRLPLSSLLETHFERLHLVLSSLIQELSHEKKSSFDGLKTSIPLSRNSRKSQAISLQ